jgi:hypothetical protein
MADFFPQGHAAVRGVELEIACNLGPAGAMTGKEEGVIVMLPDGHEFEPTMPSTGVTAFSTERERGDDD